jgi:hypothetical protein
LHGIAMHIVVMLALAFFVVIGVGQAAGQQSRQH